MKNPNAKAQKGTHSSSVEKHRAAPGVWKENSNAAYIKESPCVFQDELAGVRLVFAVGDIHLKFICL